MSTPEEKAVGFKDQGNKAFAAHDWPAAIEFYTKAIEQDPTKPAFYTNRAQANIKCEAYGYAIADATNAIELDPNFVKVVYNISSRKKQMLTSYRHTTDAQ